MKATFETTLKEARRRLGIKIKDIVAESGIDQALVSKFEAGTRLPTREQVTILAGAYRIEQAELYKLWLAEKILKVIQYEPAAGDALALAESRIEYLRSEHVLQLPEIGHELSDKLKAIDRLKEEWNARKPLNLLQLEKMRSFFKTEYTFESNRIEGNTLTLQETDLVVNEGLTISGKSIREHLEAVNHAEAVDFIIDLANNKEDLTPRSLLELHAIILGNIDRENAGRYRQVPVRISGSRHEPPQPYLLDKMMEDYFIHYRQQNGKLHPVLLAAEMHERLVSVHPFIDGNGRTSRLVMNLILLRNGYTIANLKGDNISRLSYYTALEKVQVDNEPSVFYHLVADAVESSLASHLALA